MMAKRLLLLIPVLVLIWVFNVSRPGARVQGCLTGCAVSEAGVEGGIRVISLNMLHGFPRFEFLSRRLAIIAAEIKRLNPDFVLLQEVPWRLRTGNAAQYLAAQTGMNHVYLRANGNRWAIGFEEGAAILSRYPLTNPEFMVLQPRAGFFENRVALKVTTASPLGDIDLIVTHLTNGDSAINQGQMQSLVEFEARNSSRTAIVAGDFNARPGSRTMRTIPSHWQDVYSQANSGPPGFTCCIENFAQPAAQAEQRIDYIFLVPGDLALKAYSSQIIFDQPYVVNEGYLWASDHLGILAQFQSSMIPSE